MTEFQKLGVWEILNKKKKVWTCKIKGWHTYRKNMGIERKFSEIKTKQKIWVCFTSFFGDTCIWVCFANFFGDTCMTCCSHEYFATINGNMGPCTHKKKTSLRKSYKTDLFKELVSKTNPFELFCLKSCAIAYIYLILLRKEGFLNSHFFWVFF